jgi:hypothetical protein
MFGYRREAYQNSCEVGHYPSISPEGVAREQKGERLFMLSPVGDGKAAHLLQCLDIGGKVRKRARVSNGNHEHKNKRIK